MEGGEPNCPSAVKGGRGGERGGGKGVGEGRAERAREREGGREGSSFLGLPLLPSLPPPQMSKARCLAFAI